MTLNDGAPEAIRRSNSSTACSLPSMPWVMSVTGCTRRKMYSTATVIAEPIITAPPSHSVFSVRCSTVR